MDLAETAPLPAPRLPQLLAFLRRELAPLPARAIGTVRIVIACVVTLVLCMTLQVPEASLSVWVALRVVTEEAGETLLFGIVALLAVTIGVAEALLLLTVAMDQAWLRFCLMAAFAARRLVPPCSLRERGVWFRARRGRPVEDAFGGFPAAPGVGGPGEPLALADLRAGHHDIGRRQPAHRPQRPGEAPGRGVAR